ncbi:MAG: ROK family protein, partial [Acidobacteria bacterium]|nr:ROK family protein [Acidobacteriota bacterium]
MTSPNMAAANFIGVDLSGKTMRAALVTGDGRLLERREAPLSRDNLTAQVARLVTELRDVNPNTEAIGVGVRGLVNPRTDSVYISTDLPSVVHGDFHPELTAATG